MARRLSKQDGFSSGDVICFGLDVRSQRDLGGLPVRQQE